MAETSEHPLPGGGNPLIPACAPRSLPAVLLLLLRRWRLATTVLGSTLLLCLLYCLLAPNQYEARARVELRQDADTAWMLGNAEPMVAASLLSAPLQQETLVQVLQNERLEWEVIGRLRLYEAAGFKGSFASRFSGFRADAPSPAAREWLLKRFARRLDIQSVPHTLLVEIRFRSRDAELSASVVNTLLQCYFEERNADSREDGRASIMWLNGQLQQLKKKIDSERNALVEFQNTHGILALETSGHAADGNGAQSTSLVELEELSRDLAAAGSERIATEAAFRASLHGDPEVIARNQSGDKDESNNFATALLEKIQQRRSELQEEAAQLSAEHGPNFPRMAEIRHQLAELDQQRGNEDERLRARFRSAFERARERERQARAMLEARTAQLLENNQPAAEYMQRLQETSADEALYMKLKGKVEESSLLTGRNRADARIVTAAQTPGKAVAPDPLPDFAIALFLGAWLALAAVYAAELVRPLRTLLLLAALAAMAGSLRAQAPTPSTSGIPAGVSQPVIQEERRSLPDPRQAPVYWEGPAAQAAGMAPPGEAMAGAIAPGDRIEVSEFRTPELHSILRVAADGTVAIPMIRPICIEGLFEQTAAKAIEEELVAEGVLLHPRVTVLVTASAGQDVSVLGEVARPGVYPYTLHHRLLDLISAASGMAQTAGRLVNIYHRGDPHTAHAVVLDPNGSDPAGEHNPELLPGDTVQVSRAGLVYVIGDVVRPGGFAVDPAQGLTVVQALSLAWGPAQNAATTRALLIREQKGGRTMTALNLKHMLRGEEPDQPIHDRDILFVPDSTAKNLWNKSLESAIQSAVGVTIYSALVYSQRY